MIEMQTGMMGQETDNYPLRCSGNKIHNGNWENRRQ